MTEQEETEETEETEQTEQTDENIPLEVSEENEVKWVDSTETLRELSCENGQEIFLPEDDTER